MFQSALNPKQKMERTIRSRSPCCSIGKSSIAAKGAWDALLKDTAKLKAVLSYHVITGHVLARDLKSGDVMTVQGTP